jgi:threonine/homoserine/homoserine lactone efflux protein
MKADLFAALVGFAFVMSVTPGPNNMMLLASGVNHGFRRTIPHMAGISLGFGLMVLLVGLGLGQVFMRVPAAYTVLKYVGVAYMLWLAWRIANAGEIGEGKAGAQPLTFLEAAAFQWVNPKAWVIAIGCVTNYALFENAVLSALAAAVINSVVNFPTICIWAAFGAGLRQFLADARWRRAFNWAMASLLVLSLLPVILL